MQLCPLFPREKSTLLCRCSFMWKWTTSFSYLNDIVHFCTISFIFWRYRSFSGRYRSFFEKLNSGLHYVLLGFTHISVSWPMSFYVSVTNRRFGAVVTRKPPWTLWKYPQNNKFQKNQEIDCFEATIGYPSLSWHMINWDRSLNHLNQLKTWSRKMVGYRSFSFIFVQIVLNDVVQISSRPLLVASPDH